jgi:hypothetical protein
MTFLTSPAIGEPVAVWNAWIAELLAMPQQDDSVKFALRQARHAAVLTAVTLDMPANVGTYTKAVPIHSLKDIT